MSIMRLLTFLVLLCAGSSAGAQPLIAAVADVDYPPFYYYDAEKGRWAGISVDVCEAVAKELGYSLQYERYPFNRMLQSLSSGQADIACTLFNVGESKGNFIYTSVPHAFEDIWVFTRAGTAHWEEFDLEWLIGRSLGGVRGYFYGKAMNDAARFDKLLVNNEHQLIRILLGGRVNYALGNKPAIERQARAMGVIDRLDFMEPSVYRGPLYIGITSARADAHQLAADFTRVLVEFRRTPEYRALLQYYNLDPPPY
jgi:polar amino acid transport system substrate-binding protein